MPLLFTYDTRVWLILDSGMLNQLQNWILRETILLWVTVVPILNSNYLVGMGYEGGNYSRFIVVHKGVFGNYIKLHWTK